MKHLLMDSEYASMGRWISVVVAREYGMTLYERGDLLKLLGDPSLTEERLNALDALLANATIEDLKANQEFLAVQHLLDRAIEKALSAGPCIIHECAASRLVPREESLRVMLYNTSLEHKVVRAYGDPLGCGKDASEEEAIAFMRREDRKRAAYHDALIPSSWGMKEGYDLCLDSDVLGREKCAEVLIEALRDPRLSADKARSIIETRFAQVQ